MLDEVWGDIPLKLFKAKDSKGWQAGLITARRSRSYINELHYYIREFINWLAVEAYITGTDKEQLLALKKVKPRDPRVKLKRKESAVSDEVIKATCKHLRLVVADLVWFLRYTGARPEEACKLRPEGIDRGDITWSYSP